MKIAYGEIYEVHDFAVNQSVDEIADGAAEYERQADKIIGISHDKVNYEDYCRQWDDDEKAAAETLEHPEGGAGVPDIHDIEEWEYLDGIIGIEWSDDHIFCDLIERDNWKSD